PSQPHPYKARHPHEYWFIDGRQMDIALDGVKWWSILILEGYSRTILAGAMAPTEATWAALMVLYTACVRYGAPPSLVSDSGGAYTSDAFEAVCGRLEIDHKTIVSTTLVTISFTYMRSEADRVWRVSSRAPRDWYSGAVPVDTG